MKIKFFKALLVFAIIALFFGAGCSRRQDGPAGEGSSGQAEAVKVPDAINYSEGIEISKINTILAVTTADVTVTTRFTFRATASSTTENEYLLPVPIDSIQGKPENVSMDIKGEEEAASFEVRPEGILLTIELDPNQEVSAKINFTQKLNGQAFRYSLSEMSGKFPPAEEVSYTVMIPQIFEPEFSTEPDKSEPHGSDTVYLYNMKNTGDPGLDFKW